MFSKKLVDPNWFEVSFRAKRPERAEGESNGRGVEESLYFARTATRLRDRNKMCHPERSFSQSHREKRSRRTCSFAEYPLDRKCD